MFNKTIYQNNIIAFHGPINLALVSTMANYIKLLIPYDISVKQKVFRIFIELVQNVSFYSANKFKVEGEREVGTGWVSVDEDSSFFHIKTGNLIVNEHLPILEQNCVEINQLNTEELRELKRQTRKKASIKDIGAHIGLIHTGILSGNEITIETKKIDKLFSFFTIQAKIDKHLKN